MEAKQIDSRPNETAFPLVEVNMNYLRLAAITWGTIYFAIGLTFSFTLGSDGFWTGVVVYCALFLLPLPVAIVAVWFPRGAGKALLICTAASVSAAAVDASLTGSIPSLAGACKFVMYHIPHIGFAMAYFRTARI